MEKVGRLLGAARKCSANGCMWEPGLTYYGSNEGSNSGTVGEECMDWGGEAGIRLLGSAFMLDENNQNNGYPLLLWEIPK